MGLAIVLAWWLGSFALIGYGLVFARTGKGFWLCTLTGALLLAAPPIILHQTFGN